jgi:hypothetical protein
MFFISVYWLETAASAMPNQVNLADTQATGKM